MATAMWAAAENEKDALPASFWPTVRASAATANPNSGASRAAPGARSPWPSAMAAASSRARRWGSTDSDEDAEGDLS